MREQPPRWADPRVATGLLLALIVAAIASPNLRWRQVFAFAALGLVLAACVLAIPYFARQWLLWRRYARRQHLGQCVRCGYDLTGNTTGICPECGGQV